MTKTILALTVLGHLCRNVGLTSIGGVRNGRLTTTVITASSVFQDCKIESAAATDPPA